MAQSKKKKDKFLTWHDNTVLLKCDPTQSILYGDIAEGNENNYNVLGSACQIERILKYQPSGGLHNESFNKGGFYASNTTHFKEAGSFAVANKQSDDDYTRKNIQNLEDEFTGIGKCNIVEDISTFRSRPFLTYLKTIGAIVDKKKIESLGASTTLDIDPLNTDVLIKDRQQDMKDIQMKVETYPERYAIALEGLKIAKENYSNIADPSGLIQTLHKHLKEKKVSIDEWMDVYTKYEKGTVSPQELAKFGYQSGRSNDEFDRTKTIMDRIKTMNAVKDHAREIYDTYVIREEGFEVVDEIKSIKNEIEEIREINNLVKNTRFDQEAKEFFETEIYTEYKNFEMARENYYDTFIAENIDKNDQETLENALDIYMNTEADEKEKENAKEVILEFLEEADLEELANNPNFYVTDQQFERKMVELRKKWSEYEKPSTKYAQLGNLNLDISGNIMHRLINTDNVPQGPLQNPRVTYRAPKEWIENVVGVCTYDENGNGLPSEKCPDNFNLEFILESEVENFKKNYMHEFAKKCDTECQTHYNIATDVKGCKDTCVKTSESDEQLEACNMTCEEKATNADEEKEMCNAICENKHDEIKEQLHAEKLVTDEKYLGCVPEDTAIKHTREFATFSGKTYFGEYMEKPLISFPVETKYAILDAFNNGFKSNDKQIERKYNLCQFKQSVPALHPLSAESVLEKLFTMIDPSNRDNIIANVIPDEEERTAFMKRIGHTPSDSLTESLASQQHYFDLDDEGKVNLFNTNFTITDIKRGDDIDLRLAMKLYKNKPVYKMASSSRGYYDNMDINWITYREGSFCDAILDTKGSYGIGVAKPLKVGSFIMRFNNMAPVIPKTDTLDEVKNVIEDLETDYFEEFVTIDDIQSELNVMSEYKKDMTKIGSSINILKDDTFMDFYDHIEKKTSVKITKESEESKLKKTPSSEKKLKISIEKPEWMLTATIDTRMVGNREMQCLVIDPEYTPEYEEEEDNLKWCREPLNWQEKIDVLEYNKDNNMYCTEYWGGHGEGAYGVGKVERDSLLKTHEVCIPKSDYEKMTTFLEAEGITEDIKKLGKFYESVSGYDTPELTEAEKRDVEASTR